MRPQLLGFLWLCACSKPLVGILNEVSIAPHRLDFIETALGDSRAQSLTVQNASRAPVLLQLSAPPPFAMEVELELGGGESRALDVTFSPTELGLAQATLRLTGAGQALEVSLGGHGVERADCSTPRGPCWRSTRDALTNTCVESAADDGTPCAPEGNACVVQGQCAAGMCLGGTRGCDDEDACTLDACEPVGGCVHFTKSCAEPPVETCQVALCDSKRGCTTTSAADGASCGPSDCVTARVCLSGRCQTRPVPDGYACGGESPCQARGRCAAGACVQPPATRLVEAWRRPLRWDTSFQGVSDEAGNLYLLECDYLRNFTYPCQLISLAPSGIQRFSQRVEVVPRPSAASIRQLWSDGRLILVGSDGTLGAYSDSDGSRLWLRSAVPGKTLQVQEVAADGRGQLVVVARDSTALALGQPPVWLLETLSARTGAQLRQRVLSDLGVGEVRGLIVDHQDSLYLGATPSVRGPLGLLSFSGDGSLRYISPQPPLSGPPIATFNGELLLSEGALRSTIDGSLISMTPEQDINALSSVMSQGVRYLWLPQVCCARCPCPAPIDGSFLVARAPGTQADRFIRSVGHSLSYPTLLDDGSVLFASEVRAEGEANLRVIDAQGNERFACGTGIGGCTQIGAATALSSGRWAAVAQVSCDDAIQDDTLRVYETPSLRVARTGWTGPYGSPGRTGRPR